MRTVVDALLPYLVAAMAVVAIATIAIAKRWRCERCQTVNQACADYCLGCDSNRWTGR